MAPQWRLEPHNLTPIKRLDELFAAEPDRLSRLSFEVAGLYFDWSKTPLDQALLDEFTSRAEANGLRRHARRLVRRGDRQPERGPPRDPCRRARQRAPEDVDLAAARRTACGALVDAIEAGAFGDVTGILHIGIGGSVLGPALLVDALGRRTSSYQVRFLSNIDGAAFDDAVRRSIPATTLVVVASKTFTTLETLANLEAALEWLRAAGVLDPDGRFDRVTASPRQPSRPGIDETRCLQFGEGVGGRYSLWSSVGVTARLRSGGMRSRSCSKARPRWTGTSASPSRAENVPLIAAFADRMYVEELGCQSRAVFAYDERLRLLPFYLQQLEMESNGKSVTRRANRSRATAPVTWGGTGTDAQHAVFQLLHQGTIWYRSNSSQSARATTTRTRSIIGCFCSTPSPRARR